MAGSVAGSIQRWRRRASESAADLALSVGRATQDTSEKVAGSIADTTSSVAESAQEIASEASDSAAAVADQAASGAREVLGASGGAVQQAIHSTPDVATAIAAGAKAGPRAVSAATISAAGALHSTAQGVLASDLAGIANALVQDTVKGSATIYDRAMDARFIETGIGGSHHRLFDGGHSISGAFAASRGASPDDTIVQEAMGAMLGLFRDASTPHGIPLATWNQDTFNRVAGTLESSFHIPKSWFVGLNTFTFAELIGATIGTVAVIFAWNRADSETFAKLVGGMGMSAALAANPLLAVVTVVSLARAFHNARRAGEIPDFVDGLVKGGLVAGATFAAIAIVGAGGGPAGLALLVAVVTGILANVATSQVSVFKIGLVVSRLATAVARPQDGDISLACPDSKFLRQARA